MADQAVCNDIGNNEGHICPLPERGMLPSRMIEYAIGGRVKEVSRWLDNGGDVNAADEYDRTMLHHACDENQEELVLRLLGHPDIHVNTRLRGKEAYTPLTLAACKGHHNIVEILLKAKPAKCATDLSVFVDRNQRNTGISTVMLAVQNKRWEVVKTLLRHYKNIRVWEAYHILNKVIEEYQHDIAEMLLETNHPFREADFTNAIQEVYRARKWRLLDLIFKKGIELDNDTPIKLFQLLVFQNDWINVEKYLQLLEPKAKFDDEAMEAVMANDKVTVKKVFTEAEEDREAICAGTLLTACIVGTTEALAEQLVKDEGNQYSDNTLEKALLLSSLHNNLEYVQLLLLRKRFSFKVLVRARNLTLEHQRLDVNDLFYKILEERAKEFFKVQMGDEDTTENDESKKTEA